MSDPNVADTIRVERRGDRMTVTVDGVPLPFEVEGVQSVTAPGAHPGLILTVPARRVISDDSLDERRSPEKQAQIRAKLEELAPPA